jgi:hypothetical protein
MPKSKMGGRTTRRKGRGGTGLSVESLHASFDRIDKKARAQIMKGATDSALASCIRHAWSEQFQSSLSGPALKGMVGHYRQLFGTKVRKTRKAQRGGMAPLDWTMGQGVNAAVYGRFPVEMGTYPGAVKSLDRFYESPISRSCDGTGGKAASQAGGSVSNTAPASQAGGGLLDVFGMGHAPASVPRNFVESTVSAGQGRAILNPPREPSVATWQTAAFTPQPFPVSGHTISTMAPIYSA